MQVEQKETLVVFGSDKRKLIAGSPLNIIVSGASRGGTSAVGSVMRLTGVNLGNKLHPLTHEDVDFADLINHGNFNYNDWSSLIENRVNNFSGWSLKLPAALTMLHVFEDTLPNPLYLVVVRNPISVARSLVNRDETYANNMSDYFRGYSHAISMYGECFQNIGSIKGAFAICEYEKLMQYPGIFVREFVDLCSLEVSPHELDAAERIVKSGGYKDVVTGGVFNIIGDK
ncbi:hypothetical protein CPJ18_26225 [Agrobacterium rosae]|uniref:Sulfotransferase family protein n=1 Tax=Agrobacterium rosae TaxID=1972867 RepID=A0AAE5VLX7_9HYPH|nr:hypothetical protein [Agrobacterium rosae]POO48423.1 hypothetical protein CPJ18_26225 [Agrobacterium rosae]